MYRIVATAFLASTLFAEAQGSGSISGHVFSADVNQPCRFAVVTLQAPSGGGGSYSSTTDLDGAFVLSGVVPGVYAVTAQMAGYLSAPVAMNAGSTAASSGSQAGSVQQTVRVEENQQTPVELRLERGGSLSGTVRYDDGSPAPNLDVRLLQEQGGSWKPYSTTSPGPAGISGRTDDRGAFREAGLTPGVYAIDVSLPASSALTSASGRRTFSPRLPNQALHLYTGNTFRLHESKGVEIHASEDRAGADLQIPLAGLHAVRGVVGAQSSGRRVGQGSVRLLDPDDKSVLRETAIGDGGLFSFSYVPAGNYLIHIEGRMDRRDQQSTGYEPLQQPLTIDGDLINLAFDLNDSR